MFTLLPIHYHVQVCSSLYENNSIAYNALYGELFSTIGNADANDSYSVLYFNSTGGHLFIAIQYDNTSMFIHRFAISKQISTSGQQLLVDVNITSSPFNTDVIIAAGYYLCAVFVHSNSDVRVVMTAAVVET